MNETMSQLEIEIRDFKSCPEYRSVGSDEYENSYCGQEGLSTESEHIKKGPKKHEWEVFDNKHLYHRTIKERLERDAHPKDDTDYWYKRRDEERRNEERLNYAKEMSYERNNTTTFPLGSWADANRQHEFRDNIRYWPHSTNSVIPLWATQPISAKQLNQISHHMTKEAIQRIYDTPDLKSFPCNTGFYTTQIDLTKEV